jgi:hypothetical protein
MTLIQVLALIFFVVSIFTLRSIPKVECTTIGALLKQTAFYLTLGAYLIIGVLFVLMNVMDLICGFLSGIHYTILP